MEDTQKKERKYRILFIVMTVLSFVCFIFSAIFGITFLKESKGSGNLGTGFALIVIIVAYIIALIGNCVLSFISIASGSKYGTIESSNKSLRIALFIINGAMIVANLSFMVYLLLR